MIYTWTVQTKYSFGDRVQFNSQGRKGIGTIFGITFDKERRIDYTIELELGEYSNLEPGSFLEPGILEEEIAPLEPQRTNMFTLKLRTKYSFGQLVRFDSHLQRCSGVGRVFAIDVYPEGQYDYEIAIDNTIVHQPGILEEEIQLLENDMKAQKAKGTS